jgi:hypothetical protein
MFCNFHSFTHTNVRVCLWMVNKKNSSPWNHCTSLIFNENINAFQMQRNKTWMWLVVRGKSKAGTIPTGQNITFWSLWSNLLFFCGQNLTIVWFWKWNLHFFLHRYYVISTKIYVFWFEKKTDQAQIQLFPLFTWDLKVVYARSSAFCRFIRK